MAHFCKLSMLLVVHLGFAKKGFCRSFIMCTWANYGKPLQQLQMFLVW